MPKDALSQQDMDHLSWLLNEQGDRTAFYLHYYEITGNEQALAAAKISHLTDFEGAVAGRANDVVQQQYPDQYPQGGVFDFSRDVAPTIFNAITKDFNEGTGTGVLTERGFLEAAREAWDAKGLGDQFPGNPLLAGERAADGDLKGAWDALNSQGTDIAVEAAVYAVIPDISGKPDPSQSPPENASYHLTEDGKAGFYVDRETGHAEAVFDRPADLTTEPQIQSQGVIDTFAVPEPLSPTPVPSPTGWDEEPITFAEWPTYDSDFGEGPIEFWPWWESFESDIPVSEELMVGTFGTSSPEPINTSPALDDQLQLPVGLKDTDFGTGPVDYRAGFTQYLEEPPEGASPLTLAVVSAMNSAMVDNHVPMTREHYEHATGALARGDSLFGFMKAENPDVLASAGSGIVYNAGLAVHSLLGLVLPDDQHGDPITHEPTAFLEQPAHSHLFSDKPDIAWPETSPIEAGMTAGSQEPAPHLAEPSLSEQLQLPAVLLNTDFGTGNTIPAVVDDQPALPGALQDVPASPSPEPAAEGHLGGFLSGIQDFFGALSAASSQVGPSESQPEWGATRDAALVPEPAAQSLLEQVGTLFSTPPQAPDPVANTYGDDAASPFAPSPLEIGPSFGSPFGGGESHTPAFPPSYESEHATDSGHSNHDYGYSHPDPGYSNHDSGTSHHDSGASAHDSGSGHDAGGDSSE